MNKSLSQFDTVKPKILQDNEMDIVANLLERGKEAGYKKELHLVFEILGEEYRLDNEALHAIFHHLQKVQGISDFSMKVTEGLNWVEVITLEGIDYDVLSDLHKFLLQDFTERVNTYLRTGQLDKNKLYYKRGILILGDKSIRLGNYENRMCEYLVKTPDGIEETDLQDDVYPGEYAADNNPLRDLVKNINRKAKPVFGRRVLENRNGYIKLLFYEE